LLPPSLCYLHCLTFGSPFVFSCHYPSSFPCLPTYTIYTLQLYLVYLFIPPPFYTVWFGRLLHYYHIPLCPHYTHHTYPHTPPHSLGVPTWFLDLGLPCPYSLLSLPTLDYSLQDYLPWHSHLHIHTLWILCGLFPIVYLLDSLYMQLPHVFTAILYNPSYTVLVWITHWLPYITLGLLLHYMPLHITFPTTWPIYGFYSSLVICPHTPWFIYVPIAPHIVTHCVVSTFIHCLLPHWIISLSVIPHSSTFPLFLPLHTGLPTTPVLGSPHAFRFVVTIQLYQLPRSCLGLVRRILRFVCNFCNAITHSTHLRFIVTVHTPLVTFTFTVYCRGLLRATFAVADVTHYVRYMHTVTTLLQVGSCSSPPFGYPAVVANTHLPVHIGLHTPWFTHWVTTQHPTTLFSSLYTLPLHTFTFELFPHYLAPLHFTLHTRLLQFSCPLPHCPVHGLDSILQLDYMTLPWILPHASYLGWLQLDSAPVGWLFLDCIYLHTDYSLPPFPHLCFATHLDWIPSHHTTTWFCYLQFLTHIHSGLPHIPHGSPHITCPHHSWPSGRTPYHSTTHSSPCLLLDVIHSIFLDSYHNPVCRSWLHLPLPGGWFDTTVLVELRFCILPLPGLFDVTTHCSSHTGSATLHTFLWFTFTYFAVTHFYTLPTPHSSYRLFLDSFVVHRHTCIYTHTVLPHTPPLPTHGFSLPTYTWITVRTHSLYTQVTCICTFTHSLDLPYSSHLVVAYHILQFTYLPLTHCYMPLDSTTTHPVVTLPQLSSSGWIYRLPYGFWITRYVRWFFTVPAWFTFRIYISHWFTTLYTPTLPLPYPTAPLGSHIHLLDYTGGSYPISVGSLIHYIYCSPHVLTVLLDSAQLLLPLHLLFAVPSPPSIHSQQFTFRLLCYTQFPLQACYTLHILFSLLVHVSPDYIPHSLHYTPCCPTTLPQLYRLVPCSVWILYHLCLHCHLFYTQVTWITLFPFLLPFVIPIGSCSVAVHIYWVMEVVSPGLDSSCWTSCPYTTCYITQFIVALYLLVTHGYTYTHATHPAHCLSLLLPRSSVTYHNTACWFTLHSSLFGLYTCLHGFVHLPLVLLDSYIHCPYYL